MKIEFKQEFPCGYKVSLYYSGLGVIDVDLKKDKECPLHGKKCVKQKVNEVKG